MVWFDADYGYKKKITIQDAQVAGAESNFPVLVSVTTDVLRDTGNGGHVQSSNGYDIIFTNDVEDTLLKHEIETYVNTTGQLVYWVKVDTLNSGSDTDIYMYYGKAGVVVDPSSTDTWDANFVGVYHLDEESGATCYDSTSNANHGTYYGDLPTRVVSKVGYGQDFDGSGDTINLPVGCHVPIAGTYEVMLKSDTAASNMRIFEAGDGASWRHHFDLQWAVGRHDIDWKYDAVNWTDNDPTDPDTDDHYYAIGFESGDQVWFQDLVEMGSGAIATANFSYDNFYIGSAADGTTAWFKGEMSELRVSNIKRSDNWLNTTYNTQFNPGTFMSWGAEEAGGPPANNPPNKPTNPSPGDTDTDVGLNPTLSVDVVDLDADAMDVTFYDASDDSVIDTDLGVASGGTASVTWPGLNYNTVYSWYAIADDGTDTTQSDTWSFTTEEEEEEPPFSFTTTFTITGDIEEVTLRLPSNSADNAIKKHIDRASFWSGNYEIDDDGINSQPLRLQGIETDTSIVTLTNKMKNILDMADNNEEVTIAGFGTCVDGVYVIKQFGYTTVKGAVKTYAWNIILEKVS